MTLIYIENKGEIPMYGIRLLGLSKKDSSQIGRFGTGMKESIALLHRMGAKCYLFSGTLRIDFEVHTQDNEQEMCFSLSEDRGDRKANIWYGLGIHKDFGHHDWTNSWQALREIFCNAWDEDPDFKHGLQTDNEMHGTPGTTKFYIDGTRELLESYLTLPTKLLFLETTPPVFVDNTFGKIIPKTKDKVQIFHKGVWVREGEESSLYDYELNRLVLTESRSCDWYLARREISCLAYSASAEIIGQILQAEQEKKNYAETSVTGYPAAEYARRNKDNWLLAWERVYGKNAVACPEHLFFVNRIIERGLKAIVFSSSFITMLKSIGIPTYDKVLTEKEVAGLVTAPVELESIKILWWKMKKHGFIDSSLPIPFTFSFEKKIDNLDQGLNGFVENNSIYISKQILGSPKEYLVALEEIVHYTTHTCDYTREYETALVSMVLKLLRITDEN